MFEKMQKLEVSQDELAIIEAALHTQSQILSVEAGGGASAALQRLNGVKRVLTMIDQQKPVEDRKRNCAPTSWFGIPRFLG